MRNRSVAPTPTPLVRILMTVGNPTAMIPIAILCGRMAISNRLRTKTLSSMRTAISALSKMTLPRSYRLIFLALAGEPEPQDAYMDLVTFKRRHLEGGTVG